MVINPNAVACCLSLQSHPAPPLSSITNADMDHIGGIAERFDLLLKQLSASLPLPGVRYLLAFAMEPFRDIASTTRKALCTHTDLSHLYLTPHPPYNTPADMHPGNILVREVDRSGGIAERFALLLKQLSAGLPLPGVREVFRNVVLPPTPQLVLLDTGMIAELSKADQHSVVEFFRVSL